MTFRKLWREEDLAKPKRAHHYQSFLRRNTKGSNSS
jgi:hypothetical protein